MIPIMLISHIAKPLEARTAHLTPYLNKITQTQGQTPSDTKSGAHSASDPSCRADRAATPPAVAASWRRRRRRQRTDPHRAQVTAPPPAEHEQYPDTPTRKVRTFESSLAVELKNFLRRCDARQA